MRTIYVKPLHEPWVGDARLYRFDPPLELDEGRQLSFVIISASAKPPGPPEVAAFEATPTGEVVDLGLDLVKIKHTLEHERAIAALIELEG